MKLTKTKTYPFDLEEYKRHIGYSESETDVNDDVTTLIKDAFSQLEQDTQRDIVPTLTLLEDYCIVSNSYVIHQPDIVVSGITAITSTGSVNVITGFSCQYYQRNTLLQFDSCLDAEVLYIAYSSGSGTPPPALVRASKLLVGYYHDVDSSTVATGSHRETQAYYRLIAPFIYL